MIDAAARRVRTLVVGCGSIGTRHLRNLRLIGVDQVAVCDERENALEAVASLASDCYTNFSDAVTTFQPDVVMVCTSPDSHVSLGLLAAEAGAHLFIEKPVSHDLSGLDQLESLAERRGLITMVGCNMRFHGGPARVKKWLDDGKVGSPITARLCTGSYLPAWRPGTDYRSSYSASKESGGGIILDAIHEVDLALWYFGEAREVSAMIRPATSIGLEVEGVAEILISHATGTLSSVHLNFIQVNARRFCEIIGASGTISWDISRPTVRIDRENSRSGEERDVDGEWDPIFVRELTYFLECVRDRRQTHSSLRAGRQALRVALAAKESAATGRTVRLEEV